jgi:Ser/Thr protein kinase RdoA (MazF antagonist)
MAARLTDLVSANRSRPPVTPARLAPVRFEAFDRRTWRRSLPAWCEEHLGAPCVEVALLDAWQSAVARVTLANGQVVVVKVRRLAPRLAACHRVQRALCERGFPCPRPLVDPAPLGAFVASAEELVEGGTVRAGASAPTRASAELLARMVRDAPALPDAGDLTPPPPWARWHHDGAGRWPARDDPTEVDLGATADPRWLARPVDRAAARLAAAAPDAGLVAGHADWEAQNLRWNDGTPHVVHDWDSVSALPEAAIAGLAAAVFPATDDVPGASVEQSAAFLDAYERARGEPFTRDEREVAWAAGVWILGYNAKGGSMRAPDGLSERWFRAQCADRLARAGA